ncbi:MAG: STAS domain-containing protein [Gallionellaceae bacterium]|nr:STAS domain-containing protein [Gallionellaceae bacterium]
MFDFFRKRKGSDKPSVPGPAPEPLTRPLLDVPAGSGFLVEEIGFQLEPELEDAVMLYANSRADEAVAMLRRYIDNHPDRRDPQPWLLLFDIYEVTEQRQPFDDLALDYAVRFDRAPPAWQPMRSAGTGEHPGFSFAAILSPQDRISLEHFRRECETADTVELDFLDTPVVGDDAYARTMLDCVERLARTGKHIRLFGGDGFVARLNAARVKGHLSEPLWHLLLLLLQLQGRADEYKVAASEYTVRFRLPAPPYVSPRQPSSDSASGRAGEGGQVFVMQGVIDQGTAKVFTQLREFAAQHGRVEVDLGQVTRIDFMAVGQLMNTVTTLAQAGKQVVFRNGNEMVCLLMRMLGIGQHAAIQPKVRK